MSESDVTTNDTQSMNGRIARLFSNPNNIMNEDAGSMTTATSAINDDFYFGKFCRHVPRVLRHQLISKLVNQYTYQVQDKIAFDAAETDNRLMISKQGDPGVDFKANTSIYRFHGALLFVDISGFTVLSQKLKVDDLKNQINAYFQKIVDIIHKYDGEIIKFAGDALFIIWQTKVSDTSKFCFVGLSLCLTSNQHFCHTSITYCSFLPPTTTGRQP